MSETEGKPAPAIKSLGRRRRGYGGGSGRKISAGNFLHAKGFDRWMNIAVGVMALAYVGLMGQWFHADTIMIDFRLTGAPRSEILYGWNRPQLVANGNGALIPVDAKTAIDDYDVWQYSGENGGTYRFRFAADGRSDQVTCFHAAGDRGACPDAMGINLGDTEGDIAWRLGSPPLRALNGTSGVLAYPSVGLEFGTTQYKVRRITVHRQTTPILSRIPLFLRFLVP
jgi:hypothetical protein